MSAVEVLTEYEVHQIAYLTMHGWTCSSYSSEEGAWTKPGFTREVEFRHPCNCCIKSHKIEEFDLDRAYWAQKEEE